MNTWEEVYSLARQKCGICRCCPSCNGRACRGETPGPGGKGTGSAFVRNVDMLELKEILGHAHVSTTEIYTHINTEKLRKAAKSTPLSKISYREPEKPVLSEEAAEDQSQDD